MPTYVVKKTFKYTETVEVTANSCLEAEDLAQHASGDRNYDDYLDSCQVVETKED